MIIDFFKELAEYIKYMFIFIYYVLVFMSSLPFLVLVLGLYVYYLPEELSYAVVCSIVIYALRTFFISLMRD